MCESMCGSALDSPCAASLDETGALIDSVTDMDVEDSDGDARGVVVATRFSVGATATGGGACARISSINATSALTTYGSHSIPAAALSVSIACSPFIAAR